MRRSLKLAAIAAAVAVAAAPATASTAPVCVPGGPWTGTWGSPPDHGQGVGPWTGQTLRMAVHTSAGGTQLRLHLTDEFATSSVTFAHVSVAEQLDGAAAAAPPTVVTFGGSTSVSLAAGAETVSDTIAFPTTAGERLLISVYIPSTASVSSAPVHTYSGESEYNITGSDATMATSPAVSNVFGFTAYLDGLDVDAPSAQTVVAIGDSISDLGGSPTDADARWPDYLTRRTPLAVIDQGISGGWVTADQGSNGGPSVQTRWQHDVLGVPGVRTVIDQAGINDLRGGVTPAALESAQESLVASAHAAGLRIVLTTITPCAGAANCGSGFETARQTYNSWLRAGSSGADAVADFDAAVGAGSGLASMYDSGDHLHPNAAGMESLANSIDITKL